MDEEIYKDLPGWNLFHRGLSDIRNSKVSEEALLVLIARPRLQALGIDIPDLAGLPRPREHLLFSLIEETHPDGAHSYYNSIIRRIVSFARAYAANLE
ncbi:MAG: hypothetical protein GYA55_04520 [SAR324 cluster bacterium]|uniref:Uncharacterized protein n=1 Tax=SAR324 cluster bacterium TaxID=2024889 RepID=A0A7X9IJS2_9DELT|nr:hypothetical protein [SAR324 cluster bacterium]